MPIRNFYIDCKIDGHKTDLTGGPKAKDGGFNLTIYQRSEGEKIKVLSVTGNVLTNDVLELKILAHKSVLPVTINQDRILTER